MPIHAVHLVITGRVQGVGYRAWVQEEAAVRGLFGWVRNRRDGTVEVVLSGDEEKLKAMLAACEKGPPGSGVASVIPSEYDGPELRGFSVLPTE